MQKSLFPAVCLGALLAGCATSAPPPVGSLPVGTYRVLSFQGVPDGQAPVDMWGKEPLGFIVLTPKRLMVVLTAANRKLPAGPVPTPQELVSSFVTQVAYTGGYRVEGNRLITKVDASSVASWVGTEQIREFKVEGNRLRLSTLRGPIPALPGKTGQAHLIWEKIE